MHEANSRMADNKTWQNNKHVCLCCSLFAKLEHFKHKSTNKAQGVTISRQDNFVFGLACVL